MKFTTATVLLCLSAAPAPLAARLQLQQQQPTSQRRRLLENGQFSLTTDAATGKFQCMRGKSSGTDEVVFTVDNASQGGVTINEKVSGELPVHCFEFC